MPISGKAIPELYRFNLKRLLAFLLCAFALLGSWRLCGTQCCTFQHDRSLRVSVWNRIDLAAFRFFNRWFLNHDKYRWIAKFFVVLNSVVIGECVANLTLVLLTYWIFSSKHVLPHQSRSLKIAVVVTMIVYGMAGQMALSKLSRDYLCPKRPSPSVVFRFSTVSLESEAVSSSSSDSWTIDRLFEEAKKRDLVKEIAYDSWPGEHAAVNLIWSLFMSTIVNRSSSLPRTKRLLMHAVVWSIAVLFSIARLVSGAHWLSDCLVGGLSEALIIVPIAIYTPLLQGCSKLLHQLIQRSPSSEKKLP